MESNQCQAVVEAHSVKKDNGTQNASDLLTATLVDWTEDTKPVLLYNGAVESPIEPRPPPPPQVGLLHRRILQHNS